MPQGNNVWQMAGGSALTGFGSHELFFGHPLVLPRKSCHGEGQPDRLTQGREVEVLEDELGTHGVFSLKHLADEVEV